MPNKQQFESIVGDTLRQLENLIVRLDEEYCALTGQDPQELQNAVHRKLAALAEIERNIVARDRVQTALGVPPGLIGGQQFVTQYAPELLSSWQKLTALCETISQKNAANGQLVSQGTRQTRQALSVLTGRQDDNATYGRKGANKGALSRKFLGRV